MVTLALVHGFPETAAVWRPLQAALDRDSVAVAKVRLVNGGVPDQLAGEIAAAHDGTMSQCILDFYRSAIPNIAADWWNDTAVTASAGLVLLLPDPPEDEAMSIAVAGRLGAMTAASTASTTAGWLRTQSVSRES